MTKNNKKSEKSNFNWGDKKNLLIVAIVIILIIVVVIYFYKPKNTETVDNKNESCFGDSCEIKPPEINLEKDITASIEWRDFSKITPSMGRYVLCPDGMNKGKIWMSFKIENIDDSVFLMCKDNVIPIGEDKVFESVQWTLGTLRTKEGFAGNAEELKKGYLINVCCNSKDKTINFCKNFTLNSYC